MIKEPEMKEYNPQVLEEKIEKFWKENDAQRKVKELRKNSKAYYFLDGPPYVSGAIHLGTAWNKIIKDMVIRFRTMQGYNVRRQPGFDMHGLPIEVKVEQALGLKIKKDIEETIGVDSFIKKCKEFALKNLKVMTEQFRMLGVWMDWDDPYMTIKNEYIEAAWWTLRRAWEKGLLEKDQRVLHWCPRCETALAEHEVRGEYKIRKDPSIYVKFKVEGKENEYLLIWTTTPWTLPANLAVAVNEEYDYAKVKVGEEYWIVAKALVEKVLDEAGAEGEVVEEFKGKELEGIRYVHPFLDEYPRQREFRERYEWAHRVILGEHVTLGEGTGLVHTAPGHGEEDFEIGREYGLPAYSPLDDEGRYTEGKWKGIFVKDADPEIIEYLREKGVLVKAGEVEHKYPHCWRCKTPLIFRATDQWFLKISKVKEKIIEENDKNVTWYPDWVKVRYDNGVMNSGDWCISRQRYWGVPLPIWSDGKDIYVVGSFKELVELTTAIEVGGERIDLPEGYDEKLKVIEEKLGPEDLHRPYVDAFIIKVNGKEMRRVKDVVDVWFDSGIASWASLGYPRNKELFEKLWPADFVVEGQDQVTKWFYSQQAASVIAFDTVPYKNVAMHGYVLDEKGDKMSKSLGNIIRPEEVVQKEGRDSFRFYMLWANVPWEDLRFSWTGLNQVKRMLNILWNVYILSSTYMSLDNFDPTKVNVEELPLREEDRWILSRVNSLVGKVSTGIETFYLIRATREIYDFVVEDLSRWYVRLIRKRMWVERDDPDKLAAYWTLWHVFDVLLRLMAPFTPYITEEIYQNMIRPFKERESVHMEDWPEKDERWVDEELEKEMAVVRRIVEAGSSARQKARIKLRYPVREIIVETNDELTKKAVERLNYLLKDQLNAKEVRVAKVERSIMVKPNFAKLGPHFKGDAKLVAGWISQQNPKELYESLMKEKMKVEIEGKEFTLEREHILVEEELPDFLVGEEFDHGKVFINRELTRDLIMEGVAREFVRRIQEMRKRLDLDVNDRIIVTIDTSGENRELLEGMLDYIKGETRAVEVRFEEAKGYVVEWPEVNAKIGVEKIEG
ncbi:MAG: isoleucine--tRNA ligase [Palaeococcus sp.]|uniref:isoleucine--tRNA ligase n=1 Tax=Palaeococcus sp. (in: euryarchaeotes) TaxID=2820298 RepID=UPI0025E36183|nr:isoleucine--tRNA ligase [Palaeococcus sp. (in: euryarchaeotes)]MCD6559532.1 isoleucine--tRNA ligase [Palaeococcus sp. (in: euryarchaeotes)]